MPNSQQSVDAYAMQQATQYWTERINEKRRKKNTVVREFNANRQRQNELAPQIIELQRSEQRLRRSYEDAKRELDADERTWAAMKRGQHPLGQR